jgi:chemotaxis protein methyltransferase CheR
MDALLSKQDFQRLADIVREVTGNHVQEKNRPMLESRIRSRLLKLGLASMTEYWNYFADNEQEEKEMLQSLMTTHYTFFFREFIHFEALDKWINDEAVRLKARFEATKAPVKIWSAACSRGQEVYSLAMFLEHHLLKKHGVPYEITGTDIDAESVSFAKNGVYPIKEVNTISQIYLADNWKRGTGSNKEFAAIHPNIKKNTKFSTANLLELSGWQSSDVFDVIFCRNVFIYFTEDNVKKIAKDLAKKLDSRGLFISGISEALRFTDWPLTAIGPSIYRNKDIDVAKKSSETSTVGTPMAKPTEATKYTVLCVDDSPTIQLLIKKIFSQDPNCKSVDTAIHGRDAREKLNQKKYDLITLDIHMPEVSGIEFLEKLYNKNEDPPVLMVSSVNRTDVELATKAMTLGAFDYIEKPAMNSLQKSADELLTKTKMALRVRADKIGHVATSFDALIAQKIVVPDASLCSRIVFAHSQSMQELEQIVKGQSSELRSPSLLIVWREDKPVNILGEVLKWTTNTVNEVRDAKVMLRPNQIFIVKANEAKAVLENIRAKNLSLQILDPEFIELKYLTKNSMMQVLLSEHLLTQASRFELTSGLKVSDITPATSFVSLSVEYFANIRKAAA